MTSFLSTLKTDQLYEARRLCEHALSLDPNYARAYAELAHSYVVAWVNPVDDDYQKSEVLNKAHKLASRAVQLDPKSPQCRVVLGGVLNYRAENEASLAEFEKARQLNPNYCDWRFGMALFFAGKFEEAIKAFQMHMRLDPYYIAMAGGWVGASYYHLGRYEEAIPPLREWIARAPDQRGGHRWLAATYAQLGRVVEAGREATEILRISPNFSIQGTKGVVPFKDQKDAEHLFDGLRKAGLPE
jgi:adenylate cyclase